ncbi:hypothetical protein RRG08_000464 [Elysia crispata]|uniref:Uncharacterized protein n=1 Tax=Elysia crispata TaxID=231223 RepID=A0AAE0YC08_9GAST|nr:hypothetical protein RRG08_000464 [Elysia crispata]
MLLQRKKKIDVRASRFLTDLGRATGISDLVLDLERSKTEPVFPRANSNGRPSGSYHLLVQPIVCIHLALHDLSTETFALSATVLSRSGSKVFEVGLEQSRVPWQNNAGVKPEAKERHQLRLVPVQAQIQPIIICLSPPGSDWFNAADVYQARAHTSNPVDTSPAQQQQQTRGLCVPQYHS